MTNILSLAGGFSKPGEKRPEDKLFIPEVGSDYLRYLFERVPLKFFFVASSPSLSSRFACT